MKSIDDMITKAFCGSLLDRQDSLLDKQDRQIEFYEDEIESLKDQIEDLAEALMSAMEEIERREERGWALLFNADDDEEDL